MRIPAFQFSAFVLVFLAAGGLSSLHAQNVVLNGDFETPGSGSTTGTFANWSEFNSSYGTTATNSATVHAGISGARAAHLSGPGAASSGGALRQDVNGPAGVWQFDVDFAMADPGDTTDTIERGFQLQLYHQTSGGNLHLSVIDSDGDGLGEVRVVSGAATFNIVMTDAVPFSVDADGNGLFSDPGDTFTPVHLRIDGNYDATPSYRVTISYGATTISSAELFAFQNASPDAGANNIDRIAFASNNTGTQPFIVDNVSLAVPEPTAALLAAVGGLLMATRRTRRS